MPENARVLAARAEELKAILPLQDERLPLPVLAVTLAAPKAREWALLTAALRASGQTAEDGIQMVPYLYLIGELPRGETISHLDVLTAYPNAEQLMELEIKGAQLKQLIELQPQLVFYFSARPVWLDDGRGVAVNQLDDERTYKVIVTELVSEGGPGWTVLREMGTTAWPPAFPVLELVRITSSMPIRQPSSRV